MPIDQATGDAILGTFRNFLKECQEKNASGEAFEKMKSCMARMEQLAVECSDIAAFSGLLMNENLYMNFSNAYGEVMGNLAKQASSGSSNSKDLLEQTVKAYEDSIIRLKDVPNKDLIIPVIQQVIDLGRSGVSYPVFLRICEEKGWNKAMEGSVLTREGILEEISFYEMMEMPLEIKKRKEILAKFDELASQNVFGVPDAKEFSLERIKIDWKYEPQIILRNAIINRWERLFDMLFDWLDSFCSFAPKDERWASINSMEETMKNIRRCNDCYPGMFKVREQIFSEYFGLKWNDIFTHETYLTELKVKRIYYSDDSLESIKLVYEHCKPFNKPPAELIARAEAIHNEKRFLRPDRFRLDTEEKKKKFIDQYGEAKYDELFKKYEK